MVNSIGTGWKYSGTHPTTLFSISEDGTGFSELNPTIEVDGTTAAIVAVAMDREGTLWGIQHTVENGVKQSRLVQFDLSASPVNANSIAGADWFDADIRGFAIDRDGGLWVYNHAHRQIERIDGDTLDTLLPGGLAVPSEPREVDGGDLSFQLDGSLYWAPTISRNFTHSETLDVYQVDFEAETFTPLGNPVPSGFDNPVLSMSGLSSALDSNCNERIFVVDGSGIDELGSANPASAPFQVNRVGTTGINIAVYNHSDSASFPSASASGVCSAICGDGVLDAGEECDDFNADAGDGCDSSCIIETGYQCESNPSVCEGVPVWLNDIYYVRNEGVTLATVLQASDPDDTDLEFQIVGGDDAALFEIVGSSLRFLTPPIFSAPTDLDGDNVYIVTLSVSDDSSPANTDTITMRFEIQRNCGNGNLDVGEGCDDSNEEPGDGCDATCLVEEGYSCQSSEDCATGACDTTSTNTCVVADLCGNGVLEAGESCDDANLVSGDGCNGSCLKEGGIECGSSSECESGTCTEEPYLSVHNAGSGEMHSADQAFNSLQRASNGDGREWTVATFFTDTGSGSSYSRVWSQNSGGNNTAKVYLESKRASANADHKVRFTFGTGYNYWRWTHSDIEVDNAAFVVTFDGGTTGVASDELNLYKSRFGFFVVDRFTREVVEVTSGGNWTHANYGYNGLIAGRFQVRDTSASVALSIFGLGIHNEVLSGYELGRFSVAPSEWLANHPSATAGETQLWYMGDGVGDTENTSRNQVDVSSVETVLYLTQNVAEADAVCEVLSYCGDGVALSPEACDDGNTVGGDGCSSSCLKEDGENCSDATECESAICDTLSSGQCEPADACGNGALESGEACDDGNTVGGDGCSSSCLKEDGENCSNATECESTVCDSEGSGECEPADACGNGALESGEGCDDGNTVGGDGCSSSCLKEDGENCSDATECESTICDRRGSGECVPSNACGNGVLEEGEACEDG
ncbi:MAG: DUF4215 domain-containing protein, partial [Polyangiaceae bacterium]|nr:DUF4215 domain-containing protein [Polyangiaceae bacterium]